MGSKCRQRLARPRLEYVNIIGDRNLNRSDGLNIERIQRRAIRLSEAVPHLSPPGQTLSSVRPASATTAAEATSARDLYFFLFFSVFVDLGIMRFDEV